MSTVKETTFVVGSTPDRHKEASKRAREALPKRKQLLAKKRELTLDTPRAATDVMTVVNVDGATPRSNSTQLRESSRYRTDRYSCK
jgi:hypothetical protein